ncbi:MAG: ROK family protein [Clostridiales bacterium]|jgi:predicted NBD/HSP70 family sugar kinase|nr:ROK family protein [Clostridiales bacterium]
MNIDSAFKPIYEYYTDFLKKVEKSKQSAPLLIALERNDGFVYRFDTAVYEDGVHDIENSTFTERLIKTLLWIVGGYKIYLHAPATLFTRMKKAFAAGGKREFDAAFMARIYENPFTVVYRSALDMPDALESGISLGGNYNGCRIGFDAGGSDRKVSAVLNGNVVFSEETVWNPKTTNDYRYHYDGILDSIKKAAAYLPRVDCIGVSSAGVYVNNRTMTASLFKKVQDEKPEDFEAHIKNIYIDIAKVFNTKVEVANDGDVAALAGAIDLNDNRVLGIAMGTSEAGGYIDENGNIKGWLNELAFVPVDLQKDGAVCEWSGDKGCGVKYFSQDAVIRLAEGAKIKLDPKAVTPAQKLKYIQERYHSDPKIEKIFEDIGEYFGWSILWYGLFYDIKYVLLLGRVSSGPGGNVIRKKAGEILAAHKKSVIIELPDESNRRVGQAIAAASLPRAT